MGQVTDVVQRIMALWQRMPTHDQAAHRAVAELYCDPVLVNNVEFTIGDLVGRARQLQAAFTDLRHDVHERVETHDKLVIAFAMHGRHTGPWSTSLGVIAPTGREVTIQGIDVLTFTEGRISKITVLADELGGLRRLGAVTLAPGLQDGGHTE